MYSKLISLIKRCIITSRQEEKNFLTCQIQFMGMIAQTQVFYPYGFKAFAPIGEPAITFNVLGQEDNKITMPYSFSGVSKLPAIESSEVMIGNPTTGNYIKIDKQGKIIIFGNVEIAGNLTISGNVIANEVTAGSPAIVLTTHLHSGITTGGSNSGAPVP